MSTFYAGLDVSQETTSICVVDHQGSVILETVAPTTPAAIAAALKPHRRVLAKVAHETGSYTPWLHQELLRRRLPVICLDARQTRAALRAQRNKTDRNDARDIAKIVALGFDARAYVKSIEAYRLRLLLTYRRVMHRKAHDLEYALRMSVKAFGEHVKRKGDAILTSGRARKDPFVAKLNEALMRARLHVLAEAKALDELVETASAKDPVCRRLMTVPGVGPVTALTFRAAIDDPTRFPSSRLVGAHFGLTPRRFQSGKVDLQGGISRYGDDDVRAALYDAAFVMLTVVRKPSGLKRWGMRLREKRGVKYATVACARKLAVILHRMWITETDFDAEYGPI